MKQASKKFKKNVSFQSKTGLENVNPKLDTDKSIIFA